MSGPPSRRRLLTFALLALCVTFAVLAFVPPPPDAAPERTARIAVAHLSAGADSGPPIGARMAEGPAFQRPIFIPSRHLEGASLAGGAGPVDGLKLTAVFMGPEMEKALLTTSRTPKGVWVSAGQRLEGWKVDAIHPESVVLAGPDGRHEIALEKPEAAPIERTRTLLRRLRQRPAGNAHAGQAARNDKDRRTGQGPE